MALITLLPEAVRGGGHTTIDLPLQPGMSIVTLKLISSVYPTDPTLNIAFTVLQSFDGGQTFVPFFVLDGPPGGLFDQPIGKNGAHFDGLPYINVAYDGSARTLDITVTVTPSPFSWGLSADVEPTV